MVLGIHPFPARMAPEIALSKLQGLPNGSRVLDPMAGSGTVVYQAGVLGHSAIGLDIDPLAVLMANVAVSRASSDTLADHAARIVTIAQKIRLHDVYLPWIDGDPETRNFTNYWFASRQRNQLRKIAFILRSEDWPWKRSVLRAHLRLALSRLIVTKQRGASLAWDVSHSRPHKVVETNDYDVFEEFVGSCSRLSARLAARPKISGDIRIKRGDARDLSEIRRSSIDAVLTSPPYLNAIDYLRGHKFSLVWLGYSISRLRSIRAGAIGSERRADIAETSEISKITRRFGLVERLPERLQNIVGRYAGDLLAFCYEIARVMKPGGYCWFVIGDSCLRDIFLANSKALVAAATISGLQYAGQRSREIPTESRYLPLPDDDGHALARRMRREVVLSLRKPQNT